MSKANQKFVQADEAVSPVIGVILMVAITVVLAAVVFVLVSNLGEGSESAPDVAFNKDSSARELTVVRADPNLDWFDDFTYAGCAVMNLNDDGTGTGMPTASGTNVTAGDRISGCVSGETFSLTHIATNTLVYSTKFA